MALGSGVQVGRNPNGVAVLIRSAGPNGWFHCLCQSQAPSASVAQAIMDKKERKAFWDRVIKIYRAERRSFEHINHIRRYRRQEIDGHP